VSNTCKLREVHFFVPFRRPPPSPSLWVVSWNSEHDPPPNGTIFRKPAPWGCFFFLPFPVRFPPPPPRFLPLRTPPPPNYSPGKTSPKLISTGRTGPRGPPPAPAGAISPPPDGKHNDLAPCVRHGRLPLSRSPSHHRKNQNPRLAHLLVMFMSPSSGFGGTPGPARPSGSPGVPRWWDMKSVLPAGNSPPTRHLFFGNGKFAPVEGPRANSPIGGPRGLPPRNRPASGLRTPNLAFAPPP